MVTITHPIAATQSKSKDGQFAVISSIERCDWKNPVVQTVSCQRFIYVKYGASYYQMYMNETDVLDNKVVCSSVTNVMHVPVRDHTVVAPSLRLA